MLSHFGMITHSFGVFRKQKAYCFLKMLECFLISVNHAFILMFWVSKRHIAFSKCLMLSHFGRSRIHLVFSASKKAYCFLKMLECFLISVDHAFILVFSASKKAYCFLKMLECFLISVDHAFILVFSASKKAYCFLKMLECFLIS
jgi:hypothetical protein